MKKSLITLLVFVVVLTLSASAINAVYAGNSLGSGYEVTSNWHGIDVPLGSTVIVTARTTDASVDQVTFLWKDPAEDLAFPPDVDNTPEPDGMYDGKPVRKFTSTHVVNIIGDWGVQALFQDMSNGKTKEGIEHVVRTKATSFLMIPEIPVIGTAGTAIAMLLGLGVFSARRKKQN